MTFFVAGKYILCGGRDNNITKWGIPEDVLFGHRSNARTSSASFSLLVIPLSPSDPVKGNFAMDIAEEPGTNDVSLQLFLTLLITCL